MAAGSTVGTPLVFIHIPKTAGTALRIALEEAIGAQRPHNCFDPTHLGGFEPSIITHPPMRARLKTRPEDYPADADFVVGHVAPSMTRSRYPGAPHLTVLREARSRIVSMWLYSRRFSNRQLRRWGAGGALFTAARAPLVDYLSAPVSAGFTDNVMVRQLVWPHRHVPAADFIDPNHDDELLDAALASLASMDFSGIVEDRGLATSLGEWLGQAVTLDHREHEGVIDPALRPDVTTETAQAAELLRGRSRLDQVLWQELAAKVFPDESPDARSDRIFASTVARHASALAAAAPRPLRIRLADRAWNLTHPGMLQRQ